IDFVLQEHEIPHHDVAAAIPFGHSEPAAETKRRRRCGSVNRDFQVIARDVDFQNARLIVAFLVERFKHSLVIGWYVLPVNCQYVKAVEQALCMFSESLVVFQELSKAGYDGIEASNLFPSEFAVLKIDVMDNLRDTAKSGIVTKVKALEHGLEGAVLAVMRQVDAEHVEADAAFGFFAFSHKKEAATPV